MMSKRYLAFEESCPNTRSVQKSTEVFSAYMFENLVWGPGNNQNIFTHVPNKGDVCVFHVTYIRDERGVWLLYIA